MKKLQHQSLLLSWFLWLSWIAIVAWLLLTPGIGIISKISGLLGGTDESDAVGHVILMAGNYLLFYGVLRHYRPAKQAQMMVMGLIIVIGVILELAQFWIPFRSVSLIDLLAVFVGVGIAYLLVNIPMDLHSLIEKIEDHHVII